MRGCEERPGSSIYPFQWYKHPHHCQCQIKITSLSLCCSQAERCLITLPGQGLQQPSMAGSLSCKKVGQKMLLTPVQTRWELKEPWGSTVANEHSLRTRFSWCKTAPALMSNFGGKAHSSQLWPKLSWVWICSEASSFLTTSPWYPSLLNDPVHLWCFRNHGRERSCTDTLSSLSAQECDKWKGRHAFRHQHWEEATVMAH